MVEGDAMREIVIERAVGTRGSGPPKETGCNVIRLDALGCKSPST
jgi:hypothetical protein